MSAQHKNRLDFLESFTLKPSRCLDFQILRALQWEADVRRHIDSIGWEFLYAPHSMIYPTSTREFLATVNVTESDNSYGEKTTYVDFWMEGAYHSMSLEDFSVAAGFFPSASRRDYRDAICECPDHLFPVEMWREITGLADYHAGVKGTRLPTALRVCHKLLSGSIHARLKSPESVTRQDLLALYCMATGQRAHPGYFFLEHVKNLGAREGGSVRHGYILVASLLSPLAEHFGCEDGIPAGELRPRPIDATTLLNMKMIIKTGRTYVPAPSFDDIFDEFELTGEGPQAQQEGAGTSQSDRAYIDTRFDALQRHIDARLDDQQRHTDAHIDARFDALQQSLDARFDSLALWMHRRFPDSPQDPPADD